jgi:hypothetical protein
MLRRPRGRRIFALPREAWRRPHPAQFTEGGAAILIAAPGDTAVTRMYVDLLPGRTYALACNFADGEGQPPHTALGMAKAIQVDSP